MFASPLSKTPHTPEPMWRASNRMLIMAGGDGKPLDLPNLSGGHALDLSAGWSDSAGSGEVGDDESALCSPLGNPYVMSSTSSGSPLGPFSVRSSRFTASAKRR